MGNKRSKISAQAALILSYLSLSAAQGFSAGSTAESQTAVVEFFNEMVFYTFEVSSIPEIILFFVAPLFGFYMINKNILTVGFESFEERIDRDSWKRTNDDVPTGLKGVALAVAFMTVQVAGIFGTILLLVLGALAFLAEISTYTGLFGNSSGSGDEYQELNNEVQDIKQKLDEAGAEEKDAGNSGNAAEAEDAEEEIEVALEEMEDVEMKLEELLEADEGQLTKAINEAQKVLQEEQEEQQDLTDIEERLQRIGKALRIIYSMTHHAAKAIENDRWQEVIREGKLPNSAFTGKGKISSQGFHGGGHSMFDLSDAGYGKREGFTHVKEDLQNVAEDVKKIRNIEEKESLEVKDEVDTLVREAVRFTEAFRIIQKLNAELKEAGNEDEMMEKIAREFNSKEIFQIAEQEEKEEKQLEQQLQQLRDMEEKFEKELGQAEEILENEEEGEVQEIRELKEEIQQEENIEQLLKKIGGLTSYFGPEGEDNVKREVKDMTSMMVRIENVLLKVERIKEKEASQMEKAEEKIREAISQTG